MSKTASPTAPAAPVLEPPEESTSAVSRISLRKGLLLFVGALVAAFACFEGARHLSYAFSHEETDDAEVDGDVSPVLPRVSGYVSAVLVVDNQHVRAGQPLVEVDARELDLKVASAEAAVRVAQASLADAQAGVANAEAALQVAQANAAVAAVKEAKANTDLRRDQRLFQNGAITDRDWTDSQAAAQVAHALRIEADRQVAAAQTEIGVLRTRIASAQAQLSGQQSDLADARLQRSYATIEAPIAGMVTRKMVEPGEFVQAGQTLLSITADRDPWVVANFKETQLARMKAGQPVDFTVDSYPGVEFHGRVDSIAAATGARFALLPPDNSTGNYVKVTERIPVKIVLTEPPPGGRVLRQGMSVDASVQVSD